MPERKSNLGAFVFAGAAALVGYFLLRSTKPATAFAATISNISASASSVNRGSPITISFDVTNTGGQRFDLAPSVFYWTPINNSGGNNSFFAEAGDQSISAGQKLTITHTLATGNMQTGVYDVAAEIWRIINAQDQEKLDEKVASALFTIV